MTHTDREKYTFYKVKGDQSNLSGHYGVYRLPLQTSGGQLLYLFPDNGFYIVSSCDICSDQKVKGYGTYKFINSKITFNYKVRPKESPSYLHALRGHIDKGDYITGSLKILASDQALLDIKEGKYTFDYFYQTVRYYEWRKDRDQFSRRANEQEKDN